MDKCIHDKGYCEILSDNEVKQPCIEGPCVYEMKLKPCPFCGGETKIAVCDSEGNLRDDDYEQNPWSGLGYQLIHTIEENEGCPIAKYDCDGAEMGVYIYDSKEEAIEAWNRRATCTKGTE
jgi:hypothetical protein